jgi:copper chaperone CopZ
VLSGTPRTFVGSTTFSVRGVTDTDSERRLVAHITTVGGVESVSVEAASGTVTVRAARPVDRADIAAAVSDAGFTLVP